MYNGKHNPDFNLLNSRISGQTTCSFYNEKQFNSMVNKIPKGISVVSTFHLNIRSLSKNYDHLNQYLLGLEHTFSVIALTESWLTKETDSLYELPDYNCVHYHRKIRVGGGVSLYIQRDFHFVRGNDLKL